MGRTGAWAFSTVIHGALLVGALIPLLASPERISPIRKWVGTGYFCSLGDSTWRVNRIDRSVDVFTHQLPDPWVPSASLLDGDPDGCYSETDCGPDLKDFACPTWAPVPPNELESYAHFLRNSLLRRDATLNPHAKGILCVLRAQPSPRCRCPFRVLWRNDRCDQGHGIDGYGIELFGW
jgi:hypothetical protein